MSETGPQEAEPDPNYVPETKRMLNEICHDEQMVVWIEEAEFHLAEVLIDPEDYEHGLMIHASVGQMLLDFAEKIIEQTLFRQGVISLPTNVSEG